MNLNSPSPWVQRYAGLIPHAGEVLDLACGSGRHTRFFLEAGHRVVATDIDISRLGELARTSGVEAVAADLEADPWPFDRRRFDAIIVCNYLHRPLFPRLVDALARGGVLLIDTFASGNERYGRPSNPDFLLRPGELIDAFCLALNIKAYVSGEVTTPKPAVRQSICAVQET